MDSKTFTALSKGQGDAYWIVGDLVCFKLVSEQTDGKYVFAETTVSPGAGPPPHLHRGEDEMFYVLEGEFDFIFGDTIGRYKAGSAVYLPRGTVHTFKNAGSEPARLLVGAIPGGFDKFVLAGGCPCTDIATPAAPDMNRVMAAFNQFKLELHMQHVPTKAPPSREADREFWLLGQHVKMKLRSEDTCNHFTLVEVTCLPGQSVPEHSHRAMDQVFYVLDGNLDFKVDGKTISTGPGSFIHVPQGMMHAFKNESALPARLLDYHTPGGFDQFFDDCGIPCGDLNNPPETAPLDRDMVAKMLDKYGMDLPR